MHPPANISFKAWSRRTYSASITYHLSFTQTHAPLLHRIHCSTAFTTLQCHDAITSSVILSSGGYLSSRQQQQHAVRCNASVQQPESSGDGGQLPPGSGGIGGGGCNSDNGPGSPQRKWPMWYTVWMWATAIIYLVWRYRWRRDRKLAAEQFAREQQQEYEAEQDWRKFAQSYGIKQPSDSSNN